MKYSKNKEWIPHAIRRTKISIKRVGTWYDDTSERNNCHVCYWARNRINIGWIAPFDNNFCLTTSGLSCPARPMCKKFVMILGYKYDKIKLKHLKRHLAELQSLL